MGDFSFLTSDTKESIWSIFAPKYTQQAVYLYQPDAPPILEPSYGGYGIFGGVDAFVWLAKANTQAQDLKGLTEDQIRDFGIELYYDSKSLRYPLKFSFDPSTKYEDLEAANDCPYHGSRYEEYETDVFGCEHEDEYEEDYDYDY